MRGKWGRRYASLFESMLSSYGCVYTFNAVYVITNILLFLNAAVEESKLHTNFRKYTTSIARGAGATINFNSAVVLLLASRSAIGILRETPLNLVLPLDKAMPELHRIVGNSLLAAAVTHALAHVPTYIIEKPWSSGLQGYTSLCATGILLVMLFILVRVVAREIVYHKYYELFLRTHIFGSATAYALLIIHGLHQGTPSTWKWVVGPIAIYAIDILVRTARQKRSYLLVSKHSTAFQGPDIIRIRLPRVFHFQAGQYAEIKVPQISRWQWHPFTIASAPHEPELVFYIKAVGDWTKALYKLFADRISLQDGTDIEVHVRGPFGAPAQHVGQFDRVVLVGGGVGATPFCSVVKDCYNWITNWTPRNQRNSMGPFRTFIPREATPSAQQHNRREINLQSQQHQHQHQHQQPQYPHPQLQSSQSQHSQQSQQQQQQQQQQQRRHQYQYPTEIRPQHPQQENQQRRPIQPPPPVLTSPQQQRTDTSSAGGFSDAVQSIETDGRGGLSNIFPNNVVSGAVNSFSAQRESEAIGNRYPPLIPIRTVQRKPSTYSDDRTTDGGTMHTARDYILPVEGGSGDSSSNSIPFSGSKHDAKGSRGFVSPQVVLPVQFRDGREGGTFRRQRVNPSGENDDDGMGSYRDQSVGDTHRGSMDYMSALHSAYFMDEADEVFQRSLDMMVTMSFGSVNFVRNVQLKRAQRNIRQGVVEPVPVQIGKDNLSVFQNPRIMFLLFMRSVTVNMMVLWILIIRFTMAGVAYIFDEFLVFQEGVALYKSAGLNIADLVLMVILTALVGIPPIVEIVELGSIPIHAFDMFVLTPISACGIVVDIVALTSAAKDVDELFGVFHVFVVWPVLTVVVLIRLLRVIGERIAQAEKITTTHSSTKAVDFIWTAPTEQDDQWLVGEVSRYADIDEVQLHRYLTRMRASTGGPGVDDDDDEAMRSLHKNYGRPEWEEIFNEVTESSANNTTVGVFFCGPHSMGAAVQDACMNAMRNSIVRGLQCGARAMRGLEEIFGEAVSANEYTGETRGGRQAGRGCNVTIVFKRETFL